MSQKTYVVSHQWRTLMFTRPAATFSRCCQATASRGEGLEAECFHQNVWKEFCLCKNVKIIPELICRNQRADTWHLTCAVKSDSMLCGSPCGLEKPWRHVGTYSTAISSLLSFIFWIFHIKLKVRRPNICCIARLLPRLSACNLIQAARGTSLGVSCHVMRPCRLSMLSSQTGHPDDQGPPLPSAVGQCRGGHFTPVFPALPPLHQEILML